MLYTTYNTLPSLYTTLHFLLLSILHNPSFSLSDTTFLSQYSTLPFFSWSFTTLPSPLHPTIHFLYSILHCKPLILSILHYPSFSSTSYTTLPSRCPTLPSLLSILNYHSFSSQSYSTIPSPLHSALPRKKRYTHSVECMRGEERKDSVISTSLLD